MGWTREGRAKVGDLGLGAALTDAQWEIVRPFLPSPKHGGRPARTDPRGVVAAILHVLRTGIQWRHLPPQFPPWQTVYGYFRAWTKAGVWETALVGLREAARTAAGRQADPSVAIIDSQSVKTTQKGGSAAMMRASA